MSNGVPDDDQGRNKELINAVNGLSSDEDENNAQSRPVQSSRQELHIDIPPNIPQTSRRSRRRNPAFAGQVNLENPPNQETINEANALYLLMLSEQMKQLGLQLNPLGIDRSVYRPGYWNARSLRTLAEQFAKSPQRRWVQEQAMNVDIDSLNFSTFQQLLNGLFEEGGVTWERVLVLFYFCSDISIRTFQEKFISHFLDIYNWTTVFLSGRFSSWIDAQGGWPAVLDNSMSFLASASVVAACSVLLAAAFVFLKRH